MSLRQSRTPAHLQANREKLNADLLALGFQQTPDGERGGEQVDDQPGLQLNPDAGTVDSVATVDPFRKLGDETQTQEVPGESPAPLDDGLGTGEEGELKGMAKREQDARDAQRAMSKVQLKLDKTMEQINSMMSDLGERQARLEESIQRLSTMRATTGEVPADLTPASDEVMDTWKNDYAEALSVIDARVAPLYASVSRFEARMSELVGMFEQARRATREQEIESEVYSKIPKATLKRVVESEVFVKWFQEQSPEYQTVIRNAVEKTTTVHPKTTLKVFRDFSSDTGIQIPGLNQPAQHQPQPESMDTTPLPRGGVLTARMRQAPANNLANTPLSPSELMNLKNTMATSTEAEKAILRQRLSLTQININGDASVKELR